MNTVRSTQISETSGIRAARRLLLGHRGTRLYAPENTIEAFDRALQDGCDGFEFDVRVTKDGQAVVCHGPSSHHRQISGCTLNDLREIAPTLPSLNDVLRRYTSLCFLYIELKVPGAEKELVALLLERPPAHGYVVASFKPELLLGVHRENEKVPLGFIVERRGALAQWSTLPVCSVMPKYSLASPDLVRELHAAGKRVIVWTVNTSRQMRALAESGVDGIVSDDTALLCRTLRSAGCQQRLI